VTLYLYAIVDRRPRVDLGKGMGRGPLAFVRAGKVHVLVERTEAREPRPELLVAHDRVVRRLCRAASEAAVLPLRFGSTVPDRAALEALLAPLDALIGRAFDRVRGAVQLTMRVTGRRAPPRAPSREAGPGTRWLMRRIAAQSVPEIEALTEATKAFVREAKAERHDRPPLVASVYHLVAREDLSRWRAAVRRALPELRGVRVSITGPWPPYAFAELA